MTAAAIRAPRQAAFIFIFITVLLDMMGLGMVIPVLPRLIVEFSNGDQVHAAEIYGLFSTVWALMQFLFSPMQGALSDHFGRRAVILASNFGLGLDYVLMAMAPNLIWLFVGRIISGITAASISTSYAYIADVTPQEQRAARFGMMGVAFGVGFILGPALGGLLGAIDLRLPFWAAAGFSLANALYGFFVLPESLTPEKRATFSLKRANPVGSLKLLRSHHELFGLATVSFLNNLAHAALPTIVVLYMTYRYSWDERMVGFTMALIGLCTLIVQGGVIGRFVKRFGERAALFTGLVAGVGGFATFGLATTGYWFWVGVLILAFWGLSGAATMALMSARVSSREQGQLQGANSSLMGIASMIGPVFFTVSYTWGIRPGAGIHIPGAPFLLAAVFLLLSIAVGWRVTRA